MKHCVICKNSLKHYCTDEYNRDFSHCKKCDAIFLDETYCIPFEEEKKRYGFHENTLENEGYVKMFEDFLSVAVDPFIKRRENLQCLDYGCGPGPVLVELLKRKGFNCDLYDLHFYPNTEALSTYDIITCTEVFEHFHTPCQDIQNILELLKPGGYLCIMTLFHPQNKELFEKWWYKVDPTHTIFYSLPTFEMLCEKYNLKNVFDDGKRIVVLQKDF